jgi:hypothetical protein
VARNLIGGSTNGLYTDACRIAEHHWAKAQRFRNPFVVITARTGQRQGVWTQPDLVMAADPARRRSLDEPRRLHSIEVEQVRGFDIRSVYQAHEQANGANYAWVFGTRGEPTGSDWDRMLAVVSALNVGVVAFARAHAWTTWKTHQVPRDRRPSPEERKAFIARTLRPADLEHLELTAP